ncbi:unnamed protein product [Pleuronectes platessa]|uniref:Uncharacterized protein n=1 Tax=Pleuronectes platessa TaxID=8262 RepID=A0A9N7YCK0_PLEPL|nr:unnamed protein product [Pleuronectes platessa]
MVVAHRDTDQSGMTGGARNTQHRPPQTSQKLAAVSFSVKLHFFLRPQGPKVYRRLPHTPGSTPPPPRPSSPSGPHNHYQRRPSSRFNPIYQHRKGKRNVDGEQDVIAAPLTGRQRPGDGDAAPSVSPVVGEQVGV